MFLASNSSPSILHHPITILHVSPSCFPRRSSSYPHPNPLLCGPFLSLHPLFFPSPRYTLSSSLPLEIDEAETENEDEEQLEAKIGPEDFEILRLVRQGAFGKVFQVKKKGRDVDDVEGDGIFAMKVMKKQTIIKKNHVEYMRAERDILTKVVHPFIALFSEDQATFYTAEIVSAVSHLHNCGFVHRDLKPENILVDADGHVLLMDFGLAKEIDEYSRSNSMCGTTEYMAPEILQSKGHYKDADWWSIGILLYEMLTCWKLQQRIIQEKVKLPPFLTTEAHSLLKRMFQKEPSRRLGSGPGGGDEIKKHKWFRSINRKKLEAREI